MSDTLIVFAREPLHGTVKKRLAQTTGDSAALAVYRRLLERTLRLARSFTRHARAGQSTRLVICGHKIRPGGRLSQFCANSGAALQEQQGKDLGDRMCNALRRARIEGAHRVVLIGADCPDFSLADLRDAFKALAEKQVVLASTADGGYGLIGTTGHFPALFEDMPWGSDQVTPQTLERAQLGNLSIAQIRMQADIDFQSDWQRWLDSRAQRALSEHRWDQP